MTYRLLLVDAEGIATSPRIIIRQLREFPGSVGVSVHFRPVRNDLLFESAKAAGELAYRILAGEGMVRSQIWVEYEVHGAHINVAGRSGDLLFALALITSRWKRNGGYPAIAATGVLDMDSAARSTEHTAAVQSVKNTVAKVAAAVRALSGETAAVVFYPAADGASVAEWSAAAEVPAHVHLQPVNCLEEALNYLGITLEKVYLRNPFRGLEYFGYEHRSIFFGRDAEVRELVAQLVRREAAGVPGALVEGASGCGKSSFLRAGVLPALVNPSSQPNDIESLIKSRPIRDSVKAATWRLGLLPAGAQEPKIAESIRECWNTLPELAGRLDRECANLADLAALRRERWPSLQRFVWLIDQFEELFTIGLADSVVGDLGRFLLQLQADGVWTLASIRADAVPQLKQHPTLRQVFGSNEGQYYLERMLGPALDDVISRPAAAAGLAFGRDPSGKRLDQLLREEAYRDRENALPLLQFTLFKLYENRSGRELTYAAYHELGGMAGSIATSAETTLSDAESKRAAPRIFRSLVGVDDDGQPSRRYAATAEIETDAVQRSLLERLVSARLCVTDQHDGIAVVAFAHEALLRTWPQLRDWLTQEGALLQARDLLISEARRWQQHGEQPDWLVVAHDRLASIRRVVESRIPLPPVAERFAGQSARRARRAARIRQAVVVSMGSLAVIATFFGFYFERARNTASQAIAAQFEAKAWDRLHNAELPPAVRYALASTLAGVGSDARARPVLLAAVLAIDRTSLLSGHGDSVLQATLSSNGQRVATASEDHTVRIWDASSGREVRRLQHNAKVWQASFSRDDRRVLTASGDNLARIWDADSGRLLVQLEHGDKNFSNVLQAIFSADGTRVATISSDGTAWLWDAGTGRNLARLKDGLEMLEVIKVVQLNLVAELHQRGSSSTVPRLTGLRHAAFSPDGRSVVTSSTNDVAQVWDAATGRELLELKHDDIVYQSAFSPDGARIVTASRDRTARIWDAHSGRELARYEHDAAVAQAAFSPDGREVVTASDDGTARLWDATERLDLVHERHAVQLQRDALLPPDLQRMRVAIARATNHLEDLSAGREIARLQHDGKVRQAVFSADGLWVLTSSDDRSARLWDASSGRELARLEHSAGVESASFSPDHTKVLTASQGNTAQLWDTSRSLGVTLSHGANVQQAAFSDDSRYVVTASDDHTARVWETATGRQVAQLQHDAGVRAAAFSADGGRVVTVAGDQLAIIWDVASGRELGRLSHDVSKVRQACFSPDGRRVITAGDDLTARIWDAQTRRELLRLTLDGQVNSAVFSPDGSRALTASADHTARVWDAVTGRELARLQHEKAVRRAEFARDGRRIVTASDDQTARIWDTATGKEVIRLSRGETASGSVLQAQFSPDGNSVVTASSDRSATVWDVNTGRELARFNHEGAVLSAVFTPDGRHVITASADHTARIWDVASGRELQRLQRANLMRQAAVAPDGRRILTVADDAGSLWNVSNLDATAKDLAREVCKWLPKEQRRFAIDEIESDPLVREVFLAGHRDDRNVCEGIS
jgi:WD40 repeat protein